MNNIKKLKERLIEKRKIIRNKLNLLKHGDFVQENMMLPITKHLKNIENIIVGEENKTKQNTTEKTSSPKKEQQQHQELQQKQEKQEPAVDFLKDEEVFETYPNDDNEIGDTEVNAISSDNLSQNLGQINERVLDEYLEQYHPLPRKYVHDMMTDTENSFDHKYGVRHDYTNESFTIGNSNMIIDGSDFIIQNKRFKGTSGLYELLFKKVPRGYTKNDLKEYKEILLKTNAHKRYYQANQQVDGNKLQKYIKIIAPLTTVKQRSKSSPSDVLVGGGLQKEVNNNPVDFIYWDDPNELVDRLRLLIASQQAGNFNHRNEIISIIEELRENNIVE